MKVIATAVGFHGKLRQVGEQFDVADGTKGTWFVPAPKAKPETPVQARPKPGSDDLV